MKRFAVFILSHGRANEISTVKMLERGNYTGDWYVVIDNEDDQENLYREKFKDHIIMFDKKKVADKTDTGDLDTDRRVGVFARNAIQEIARDIGYEYHLQLDDDFSGFTFRYPEGKKLASYRVKNLNKLFDIVLKFIEVTPITSLSFSLSSDFLGGAEGDKYKQGMHRKSMGTFFLKAKDNIDFIMRMNDDITTGVFNGMRGKLFFSLSFVQTDTPQTQQVSGGMTDIYKENGTYRKSFYSVMVAPSCFKIALMGIKNYRIHHKVCWNNAIPKILNERYKK